MKLNNLIIIAVSIIFFSACNKEEDLFDVMPESDLIALEGMDLAYDEALLYNDSLGFCSNNSLDCTSNMFDHYETMFHQFETMFDEHHKNYSHNNVGDDHHHEGTSNIRHGWMMNNHGQEEHNEGGAHGYEHNMESLDKMTDLMKEHQEAYH